MRSLRPSTILQRALVAIASLLLSFTALPGSTLCTGANGHVAIEAVGSECVSLSDEAAHVPGAGALLRGALHGCTDTPLGVPSLRSSTDPSQAILLSVALAPCGPVLEHGPVIPTFTAPSASALPSSIELSTVLLL